MEPAISIVMCCYNSSEHIKKSIDSILCQSFKDFEFIIWDDGSKDDTKEIVQSYSDERIRYYYHENTGLGQALRFACEKANASIIARMDSDDIAIPNRLELEYNYLITHPDTVLVSSAVNYIDDSDRLLGYSFPYTKSSIVHKIMKTGGSVIVHPASMFRKSAYDKAGGYLPLKKAQDSLLFSKMMKYGKLVVLPDILLNYRISLNSISSQTSSSSYDSIIVALRKKMIYDETVSLDDIRVYNEIVLLAKKQLLEYKKENNSNRMKMSTDMKAFSFLSKFLGTNIARSLLINSKNLTAVFLK